MRHSFHLRLLSISLALSVAGPAFAGPVADWQAQALAFLPAGYVAGAASLDEVGLIGTVAAFPVGADNAEHPGSAFDPGFAVTAKLQRVGGALGVASASFGPRQWPRKQTDANEAYHANVRDETAQAEVPDGVMPCRIFGWSASDNPDGLDIHAEADAGSAVIGRVQAPFANPTSEVSPAEGWRAEFTVVGYRDHWVLIDNIQQPGAPYGEAQAGAPAAFAGRGWVPANQVAGAYANTQMPVGWLLQAPNVDAAIAGDIVRPAGESLSIDGTLTAILACSANWALTDSVDGTRGWWRGICSNQATNCS